MNGERTDHKRGRPRGTGRHQAADELLLATLADRKATTPSAPTATLIKQLISPADTAGLRRLQRKFRSNEAALTAAAMRRIRERKEAERYAAILASVSSVARFFENANAALIAFERSPKGQAILEQADHVAKGFAELLKAPQLQPWLELARLSSSQPSNSCQRPRHSSPELQGAVGALSPRHTRLNGSARVP